MTLTAPSHRRSDTGPGGDQYWRTIVDLYSAELGTPPRRRVRGRHRRFRRYYARWTLAVVGLLAVSVAVLPEAIDSGAEPDRTLGAVDVSGAGVAVTPRSIGLGVSTYGATVLSDPVQARYEHALGASLVRIPVAVRNGVVTSGAAGAYDRPVRDLVRDYLRRHYQVLIVMSGPDGSSDVRSADARVIVDTFGYDNGVQYSTVNEPDNHGHTLAAAIAQARQLLAAGRRHHPDFRVWGPVWSHYDRGVFREFAAALGDGLAGIDYHAYAMGERPLSTARAMAAAPLVGRQVRDTLADLHALGLDAAVAIDELNLTWRFEDGVPGGDRRLLSAIDTVWIASACGHIMSAGGSCLPYAGQNGPLGMLVQSGEIPRDRQASTPMPGYWGIAAWTGAGLFPGLAGRFVPTHSDLAGVEIFGVGNTARGVNIVVINKNPAPASTHLAISLAGVAAGSYVAYSTDPARPYEPPVAGVRTSYTSSVSLELRPMSVTTLVLRPDQSR